MGLKDFLKSNQPLFEISYRRKEAGDCLELYIDQQKIDPSNNRVASITLTYPRDKTLPISHSFALEPAGNIHALTQLLESQGLSTQIDPYTAVPRSRRSRLKKRGIEYGEVPIAGLDTKEAFEKIDNYAGVVRPYVNEGHKVNYGNPVFEILKNEENGFLSKPTVKALEMAIQRFEQSDPSKKFDTRQLERELTDKFNAGRKKTGIPDR